MAFDFPNAPAVGAVYQPIPGLSYRWDGTAWKQVVTSSMATAQTRNRVVNPAMQISQENGNTSSGLNNYHMADNWMLIRGGTGTYIGQRVQATTPDGSVNRCRISVTVADAAIATNDCLYFAQPLEGVNISDLMWGTAQAKQAVVRFGFRGAPGTYCFNIENAAFTASYVANFTISGPEANTDVIRTFVIPPCTFGTWQTGAVKSLWFDVVLMAGPTFIGNTGWSAGDYLASAAISNGAGTVGNVFELFDVGLYLDPDKTGLPPPWQMPDEAEELLSCRRYWQKTTSMFSGNVTTGQNYYAVASFNPPMRASPALSGAVFGGVASFPNTLGGLSDFQPGSSATEYRTASATSMGVYSSTINANARL